MCSILSLIKKIRVSLRFANFAKKQMKENEEINKYTNCIKTCRRKD